MSEPTAFLNGRWIPASAAAVSVGDAGFVLGTTVAEQLRTFQGTLFRLDAHLARLFHSLEILGVDPGLKPDEFARIAEELVPQNYRLLPPGADLGLSIVVTPGMVPRFATAAEPSQPTVCMHTYPLRFQLWAEKYRTGQALAVTDVEQVPARCWPPSLKCRSRMHYYLADRQAALLDPSARALLLDAQGFVTETTTANVLVYRCDRGLISPPFAKILHGISLMTIVELAAKLAIPLSEQDLAPQDVAAADEAMLTSTSMCLLPATRLNGLPIGDGRPGPIFAKLLAAWSAMVGVDIAAQAMGAGD
jgi:branched-subunit amino acid aminotransferase/4-amino-4-deoxychorismate lyase